MCLNTHQTHEKQQVSRQLGGVSDKIKSTKGCTSYGTHHHCLCCQPAHNFRPSSYSNPKKKKTSLNSPFFLCSNQPNNNNNRIYLVGNKLCTFKTKASKTTNMTSEKKVEVFDSEEALSVSLAKYTTDLSEKFTKQKNSFTVVLSGGSLIKSLRQH